MYIRNKPEPPVENPEQQEIFPTEIPEGGHGVGERRAPDQDGAMEAAFEGGTLPEADRRASDVEIPEDVQVTKKGQAKKPTRRR